MKKFINTKMIVFFILSVSIIVFLFSIIDINKISEIIVKVKIPFIFGASLCYLFSNLFKTIRFKIFFSEQKITFSELFSVVSYHNFFNQIMPARTGELTLIYYLKKICRTDVSRGFHSLLVVRFLDLFMVAVFFLLSFFFSHTDKITPAFLIAAAAFGIISLSAALFINHVIKACYMLFSLVISALNLKKYSFILKLDSRLEKITEDFENRSVVKKLPMLAVSSIFVWFALYTFSYFIIKAFSINLDYFQSVLGATASVLTNVLPINSFGSFGTMEAGWVGGYYLVGVNKDIAVVSAFAYHLVNFFTAGFIALLCKIFLILRKKQL